MLNWEQFVITHGRRARTDHLAHIVGQSERAVRRVRAGGLGGGVGQGKTFGELFALWHGRAPRDDDWPAPRRVHAESQYEWQAPEVALLARLVGRVGPGEIAAVLTQRLRRVTSDPAAVRTKTSVQLRINRIGLQTKDVVGGVTIAVAAREVGGRAIIDTAVRRKQLHPTRVGRLWVIAHEEWAEWKAGRVFPPAGYVPLAGLRQRLAIRSDKLSEYARLGYVPTAIRCNPYGTKARSTQFGTWYISGKVARKLLADRRAGRAMPWHGKPYEGNLQNTWRRWRTRKHPASCEICREIWGTAGAPSTYEDYVRRYPALAHGEKRHLTLPWSPGLTIAQLAQEVGRSVGYVTRASGNGQLQLRREGRRRYIKRAEATRWKARGCPSGNGEKSWIAIATAARQYDFSAVELRQLITEGRLEARVGAAGAARGIQYVARQQCADLRARIGYRETDAARRLGVSVARLRVLLDGVDWRRTDRIPLASIAAAKKRLESQEGYTLSEAARQLGKSVAWVQAQVRSGAIRVSRAKWDRRRIYVSEPMLQRLRQGAKEPVNVVKESAAWLGLSDAAHLAGISTSTLMAWADQGLVKRRQSPAGWRYHRTSVKAAARRYWPTARFKRPDLPAWLVAEQAQDLGVQGGRSAAAADHHPSLLAHGGPHHDRASSVGGCDRSFRSAGGAL